MRFKAPSGVEPLQASATPGAGRMTLPESNPVNRRVADLTVGEFVDLLTEIVVALTPFEGDDELEEPLELVEA